MQKYISLLIVHINLFKLALAFSINFLWGVRNRVYVSYSLNNLIFLTLQRALWSWATPSLENYVCMITLRIEINNQ